MRIRGLSDLHSQGADAAGGTIYQQTVVRFETAVFAKRLEDSSAGKRQGGGLLEAQAGRLADQMGSRAARQFSKRARAKAKHFFPGNEVINVRADCLNNTCDIDATDELPGAAQSLAQAQNVGLAPHEMPVDRVYGGSTYTDEDAVWPNGWNGDPGQCQYFGPAVPALR
jgi:hypothetical protein